MTDLAAFGPVLGGPPTPTDLATLRQVVDQQRGLVTRQQCLAAGITYRAVRHRLDSGRWTRVRHGVYLTVPGREGWWWDATSALLSVGSGAAWAFGTAGFAHGLVRIAPTTVELVVDAAIHVRPAQESEFIAAGTPTNALTNCTGRGAPGSRRRFPIWPSGAVPTTSWLS